MDPTPKIADVILFPSAAYQPDAPETALDQATVCWGDSELNPANRVDSVDDVIEPIWEIDGAEADGQLFWAIPSFARGRPPRRIDVYYQELDANSPSLEAVLETKKLPLVSHNARGSLGVGKHLLRALEHWSSKISDFESKYMSLPYGSQIAINDIKRDVRSMSITLVPDYDLERQWLPVERLEQLWDVQKESMPESIDIDELCFKRQLRDSISLVGVRRQETPEDVIFKSHTLDSKIMYGELQNLLALPDHPNLSLKPLYLVTKRVRFGGKRGVCGFIVKLYPLGSLEDVMRHHSIHGRDLPISTRLRWAREIATGVIAVRDSPLRYYSDLKLDNILIDAASDQLNDEAGRVVLIDFEQATPWMHRAPPEVYWVDHIERLAAGSFDAAIQEENAQLLRSLIPTWKPKDRHQKYGASSPSNNPAWDHLNAREKDSAVVFMLGKLIWSILEGAVEITEPVTISSFHWENAHLPGFPTFNNTPSALRGFIKRCTSGAPEWSGRRQPFYVRHGKLYLRNGQTAQEPSGSRQVQAVAREWWKGEIKDATRFVNLRVQGAHTVDDRQFLDFMNVRPSLEDVLQAIKDAELVATSNL